MAGRLRNTLNALRSRINTATVAGAVRGVIGDKLPAAWRGKMQFCEDGKILPDGPVIRRPHVCIFVHGSADTELGWQAKKGELDFGAQLVLEFGVQPLYIRYNSGLSLSENGSEFSHLLGELTRCHKSIRKITLIGHSMGGLVIHAAVYDARARKLAWTKLVKQVYLLGTPHAGAPLAKLAEKGEELLQFIPTPLTLIAASVIGFRSRGLKDLSRGQKGISVRDAVLLPHADYTFVAGGLQKNREGMMNRLIGDGMVRNASALPKRGEPETVWRQIMSRVGKSARVHVETAAGVGHLALRNSPVVYRLIAARFKR